MPNSKNVVGGMGCRACILALAVAGTSARAPAADIAKANNATNLDLAGSWLGGTPPGFSDVALWNNTVTTANNVSLGANLSWSGIRIANPGGDVAIANDGNTLTLDAAGIDMSAATRNLTINSGLFLNADQSWNVATRLMLTGTVGANDGQTIIKSGAGTLALSAAFSGLWTLEIDAGTVRFAQSYAITDTLPTFSFNGTSGTLDLAGFNAVLTPLNSGRITNSSATSSTLTLGAAIITATISDGTGPIALVSDGATLMSRNTYSGATTVKAGGLTLWFETATSNLVSSSSVLALAGGQLGEVRSPLLAPTTFLSQTFASTTLVPGESSIVNAGALNIGAFSRSAAGSTVDFQPAVGEPASSGIFTTASLTSSGILGGWATINGADWATRNTTSGNSIVTPLAAAGYSNAFSATANTDMTANLAAANNASTGSIRFNSGSKTLTLTGANIVNSGGILVSNSASNQGASLLVTGATSSSLTSGNSLDLIIHQEQFDASLTIAVRIVDNGITPIALTKSGPGTLALSASNSFSGGTSVNNGALAILPGASIGPGPITLGQSGLLVLADTVNLPNNLSGATSFSVPAAGSATFSGSFQTASGDGYLLSNADTGSLTITGTHVSGALSIANNPGTLIDSGTIIFAATGSLTSYHSSITVGSDHGSVTLTLKDSASLTVSGLSPNAVALDMINAAITLRDSAYINLGPGIFHAANLLAVNGGSITTAGFNLDANTTLSLNGGLLIPTTDNSSFFTPTDATSKILVGAGGAKFNPAGFSITIPTALTHDPALGANPDGGLTLLGPGTLTVAGSVGLTGTIFAAAGTLAIAHAGSGSNATYSGVINLMDNKLIVQSTDPADKATKITDLNAAITAGANGATWTGHGIASSTAASDANHLGVGLFDNAILQKTSFGGQPTDTNSILVAVAHLGDANRNGIVDIQDISVVANNWQQPRNNWAQGDFNRDGIVNIQDFSIVANNWQQTSIYSLEAAPMSPALSAFVAQNLQLIVSPVPEPASLLFMPSLIVALLQRRRR